MTDHDQFACTLTIDESRRREPGDRALAAQLQNRWWDSEREVVLTFPREAEGLVREFVRRESSCCAFFRFDVQPEPATVRLRVSVPAGGEHMIAALAEAFPGLPG